MEQPEFRISIKTILVIIIIIVGLFGIKQFIESFSYQPNLNKQIKQTTKKIDSLKQNKETSNKAILDTFKRNTIKASTLIKSLPKEPSIILQADYKAMCDSILNYKPTNR